MCSCNLRVLTTECVTVVFICSNGKATLSPGLRLPRKF